VESLDKRKGLVANFRLPTFPEKVRFLLFKFDADIDDLDTNNFSHQTGENRTVKLQAGTLPSTRPDAGESAVDLDPSDSFGVQWDRGKGTPALLLQDEVGPVKNFIGQGESIDADNQEQTRSSTMKEMRVFCEARVIAECWVQCNTWWFRRGE
jgi:hypothetical protein